MRRIKHSFVIFYCILSLVLAGLAPSFIDFEQNVSLISFFKWRGERSPPSDVVIVSINSQSGSQLGLPAYTGNWPRSVYTQLIDRLIDYKARLIVFDIYFVEARESSSDHAFADAIARADNVILFKYLKRHQVSSGLSYIDIEEEQAPLPLFDHAALASGAFTVPKYPARVTSAQLYNELSSGREPSQPLLAYLAAKELDLEEQTSQFDDKIFINYYGPPKTITTVAIEDIISESPTFDLNSLQDKIIYVGFIETQQTEQRDAYRTAFSNDLGVDLSGVEISATVLSNLLHQNYIRRPSSSQLVLLALAVFACCALAFQLPFLANCALQTMGAAGFVVGSFWLFKTNNFWVPVIGPLFLLAIANASLFVHSHRITRRNLKRISSALENYLPKHAAKNLGKNLNALEKQHSLVHGICLVTDIKGYTALSEKLDPSELHALMNLYYDKLVNAVKVNHGFVGNIVGDSLLALWTGPEISEKMCTQAFKCAEQILADIADNPTLKSQLSTCVALHGGQFSLGNLGASGHFEYSPVGDIINTSTRVEHFNRNLGTEFLCTQVVAEKLMSINNVNLHYLGNFALRNKANPTPMYSMNPLDPENAITFCKAVQAYENKDFESAQVLFKNLLDKVKYGPALFYLEQLKGISKN